MKRYLKKLYNQRLFKNIRNYFRTKKLLGKGFGQIDFKTDEGNLLFEFIKRTNLKQYLRLEHGMGLDLLKQLLKL